MTEQKIIERVRAAIDALLNASGTGVTVTDAHANLDAIIKDKIPYALMYVLQNAPQDLLDEAAAQMKAEDIKEEGVDEEGHPIDADLFKKKGYWSLRMPEGTLRILSARLSTWMRAPEPVDESSVTALMQLDRWARGSWDRPVVVIRKTGTRFWLDFYAPKGTETKSDIYVTIVKNPLQASTTGDTETGTGLPSKPEIFDEIQNFSTDIAIPLKLEAAFIYQIAALTCTALREDISSALFTISNRYLGIAQQMPQEAAQE